MFEVKIEIVQKLCAWGGRRRGLKTRRHPPRKPAQFDGVGRKRVSLAIFFDLKPVLQMP